jgi:rod shape-determining protein MreD
MITVLQRLDRLARNCWPFVLSLLLVVASVLPLQLPDFGRVAPNLAVMATFYWAIYRPDLFPAPAAFALGLWLDLLTGTPIGINALVLLLVH